MAYRLFLAVLLPFEILLFSILFLLSIDEREKFSSSRTINTPSLLLNYLSLLFHSSLSNKSSPIHSCGPYLYSSFIHLLRWSHHTFLLLFRARFLRNQPRCQEHRHLEFLSVPVQFPLRSNRHPSRGGPHPLEGNIHIAPWTR